MINPKKIFAELFKKIKTNKKVFAFVFSLLIIAIGAISTYFILLKINDTSDASQGYEYTKLEKGIPDYQTVLPDGKTIDSLGGWTKISPPNSSPVYTYVDKIGDVQINVSEQPLPEDLNSNPEEQVAEMAKNFGASELLTVDNISIYIGTSVEGQQSIIFTKNNLLILIKSVSKISNDSWIKYVNSLQ